MIELRWLERVNAVTNQYPEDMGNVTRVLQFRAQNGHGVDQHGYVTGPTFGDWQDVPLVREE